ncbi:MAG TPA: histidine ammonia-lyase [Thermoguttaceae bacterium]|nr:histidine ammonia-lyase [Thermoguttaceae bacterium]
MLNEHGYRLQKATTPSTSSGDAKIALGSGPLSPTALWDFAQRALTPGERLGIDFSSEGIRRIRDASNLLAKLIEAEEPVYGVNTGFGHFANTVIPPEKIIELQYNLVRSHCCGVGELLSRDIVLAMWLINLNTICQGHSGVRLETMRAITKILESGILSCVPSQGSVGASGDLAPSAHATLTVLGEGRCTMPEGDGFVEMPAEEAIRRAGLKPVSLGPKEGLSLMNGTALTTALGVKAWYEGSHLLDVANLAAAMSIEALGGSRNICAEPTLRAHGHPGTIHCGRALAGWLGDSSQLSAFHMDRFHVQDPYSLRCAPQVHGAIWQELQNSATVLEREINATTDNPLLFPDEMMALCCGNFHAIYPARVNDALASAMATLANISERRINLLMRAPRGHLHTFLIDNGGVNSGFMMAHVTAAALVSECKSLSFPASVDSIPTSLNQEDHVSMGPIAGMKVNRIVENLRRVLAIELLTGAQAFFLLRPRRPAPKLGEVYLRIREFVPPLKKDRNLSDDIELVAEKIRTREILPENGSFPETA